MKKTSAFSLIELLVVIAIVGIIMALLMSAVQKVRESANRLACQNNIKQISLGLHQLSEIKGKLPPGIYDPLGDSAYPAAGWQVGLLPFIEQQAMYDEAIEDYKRDRLFYGTGQSGIQHSCLGRFVKIYSCPSDGRVQGPVFSTRYNIIVATTSYLGSCGLRCTKTEPDGILFSNSSITLKDVTDGLSNTIFVGERPPGSSYSLGWWYAGLGQEGTGSAEMILGVRERYLSQTIYSNCPQNTYEFQPGRVNDGCDAFHFWSVHPGGGWFGFGDGSVRFLNYSANPIMPALASRAGGEAVNSIE
jgi:prepilin-type N-terminal cleavage/methylation domain-containing protein